MPTTEQILSYERPRTEGADKSKIAFSDLSGLPLALVVRSLVERAESNDHKPDEARQAKPNSVLSLMGDSYGTLFDSRQDPTGAITILDRRKSDASLEWEAHDTLMSHLLGTGVEPVVVPKRGKAAMAEAMKELALHRWAIEDFEGIAECILEDSRMHGTSAGFVFVDPATGLARTTWIPVDNLVLDPSCYGDLSRTRYRAVWSEVSRTDLRKMLRAWDKPVEWAEDAGIDKKEPPNKTDNPLVELGRMMEPVRVLDFYWACEGQRRRIVLVDGIHEPVWDVNVWPYELPPGRWPIIVHRWNKIPGSTWGASDHKLTELMSAAQTWALRFTIDASAEAVKLIAAFDKSLGDQDKLTTALGSLRESYKSVPLDLLSGVVGGATLDQLLKFLQVPSNVAQVQPVYQLTREVLEQANGLADARAKQANPTNDPPRLARKMHRWRKFLSLVLEAESCADLTHITKQATVSLTIDRFNQETQVFEADTRYLYVDLQAAESLQRNQTVAALRNGLTAEQWNPGTLTEQQLRAANTIDDREQVRIIGPGIARYVSRQSLVDAWEGGIAYVPGRVVTEYSFGARIRSSLQASEASLNRTAAVFGQLSTMFKEWGMMEGTYAWSEQAAAAKDGDTKPLAPRMLQILLMLYSEMIDASGVEYPQSMSLLPEDLAQVLAAGKKMMDEQAKAQAEAAQPPAEDPMKAKIEMAKLQLEVQKLELQRQREEYRAQHEQTQAQTELTRQQFELAKQQRQAILDAAKVQQEMAELPAKIALSEARRVKSEVDAIKAQVQANRDVMEADHDAQDAQNESAITQANAKKMEAEAALKMVEVERKLLDLESARVTPPDTKQAKELAEAQKLLAEADKLKSTKGKET